MAERAQVTSIEAIELFRSRLIVYLSKARPTLEEASSEVLRTRTWLENDQRSFWENQMKRRKRELEQAQGELFSARISKLQTASAAQELAVHRAQRAIREAEAKFAVLKKWTREMENRTQPLVRLVEQLNSFITVEMTQAVIYLAEVIRSLQAYASAGGPSVPSAPAPAAPASTAGDIVPPAETPHS
jgi:hypothetical protein